MYCVRNVTSDLYWVGANDHRLALFENCFPIPRGVSYNAYCLLDEMGPKEPFCEYEGFALFLVGSSDHCLSLTSSLDDATGVVIAEE